MKVYLCSDGDYSDYHVTGIYSTEEKANEAKRRMNWSNGVEVFEIDSLVVPSHVCYTVTKYLESNYCAPGVMSANCTGRPVADRTVRKYSPPGTKSIQVEVMAEDVEHAKKIAADLFAQYQAQKEGIA